MRYELRYINSIGCNGLLMSSNNLEKLEKELAEYAQIISSIVVALYIKDKEENNNKSFYVSPKYRENRKWADYVPLDMNF